MTTAIIFTILFAISGICISEVVFQKHKLLNRIWLGLVIGLLLLTWLPSLFAFAIGFTLTAQILALITAILASTACSVILILRRNHGNHRRFRFGRDWIALTVTVPILIVCIVLLDTHILKKHPDGSLWVGQVTYGDLAMHLGFITSIAEQKTFPPQYSIFPGHALNYPFLCETSGASLFQLGASVRAAYLISAIYAAVLVVLGVYLFFEQWLKRKSRAVLATILFFVGSGFGFFYFFDLSQSGGTVTTLMGTKWQTVSQTLLDNFYYTPTNMPALGLRWVNPIVDMMIPQRATLFGWAFLFPCLYLLHGFAFENKHKNVLPLAIIAGSLPMIHTHSFLALGIVSAVYCIVDLISVRFAVKRLLHWGAYALIACALAAPQLFLFTFRQTTESGMVRFYLNWDNKTDSYLWFYIKNLGLIFLLMPIAFLVLPKRDKKIYAGAIALWIIAELVEFQPNDYDNNKLLFVWYAFTCGLVAKLLLVWKHRIACYLHRRIKPAERQYTYRIAMIGILSAFLLFFLFKGLFDAKDGLMLRPGTAFTLFFCAGLLLALCIGAWRYTRVRGWAVASLISVSAFSVWLAASLLYIWLDQYIETEYSVSRWYIRLNAIFCIVSILIALFELVAAPTIERRSRRFKGGYAALSASSYLLIFIMIVSSLMTILREWKSEYQVYTKEEAALSEQIRSVTESDAVILANSYHWNLVTPLTGRSIVTGTGTYLFYHGIDTSQREADVRRMFETPADCTELFRQYNVRYVLLSNAERGYDVDYAYFRDHTETVAKTDAGTLLRIEN